MSRIMGIDYGKKRIGIAVSDELRLFARPYNTIYNTHYTAVYTELSNIIEREKIDRIVVGLPRHLDGSASKQTDQVLSFINKLKDKLAIPVDTFDERYSSCEAQEILLRNKVSLKANKDKIDQIAAAVILQNYLNCSGNK